MAVREKPPGGNNEGTEFVADGGPGVGGRGLEGVLCVRRKADGAWLVL